METVAEKATTRFAPVAAGVGVRPLAEIETRDEARIPTGIAELDRVLGGGLVPGGVVLLGGDPGIGKINPAVAGARRTGGGAPRALRERRGERRSRSRCARSAWRCRRSALECSPRSISRRSWPRSRTSKPAVAVIDSIQTVYTDALHLGAGLAWRRCASAPRSSRAWPRRAARDRAGRPRHQGRRARRAARAGAHRRHGALLRGRHALELPPGARDQEPLRRRQRDRRLRDDRDGPEGRRQSERDLSLARTASRCAGSCVLVTLEGTRPLLVEIQALVDERQPEPAAPLGAASTATGWRCCSRCCIATPASPCFDQDVFVNAVGGVRIGEPAADLAVMLAIQCEPARQAAAARLRRLRRSRPRRRDPAGAARPGAAARGGQARLHPRDRPEGEPTPAADRRDSDHDGGAHRGSGPRTQWVIFASPAPGYRRRASRWYSIALPAARLSSAAASNAPCRSHAGSCGQGGVQNNEEVS